MRYDRRIRETGDDLKEFVIGPVKYGGAAEGTEDDTIRRRQGTVN